MSARRIWIGTALLALVITLCLLVPRLERGLGRTAGLPSEAKGHSSAAPAAQPVAVAQSSAGPEEPSQLTVDLNSPTGDIHADLRIVDQIFIAYRAALHEGNPVGENNEITAALTGRNKLGFAFVPRDCPALNAKGELCDRWGKPYFFHQISGEKMEIRSGGPDKVLWTDDDVVLTP
jgi:hypothetical protein